jgi:topoisomerase-4 subunit A
MRRQRYLGENPKSTLIALSDNAGARFQLTFGGADDYREPLIVDAAEFIAVKSFKAKGKRLTTFNLASVTELEPRELTPDEEDLPIDEGETDNEADDEPIEPDRSDDEVRDEINGQQRIF